MNAAGTVSVGYNSLGFDDEFLRFSFYRNLLPAYSHQYRNGCRRMDILPVAILFWLYKPEVLNWPQLDGKASLKLEHLSAANDLLGGPSHDAAADAEATLQLARRLITNSEMWHYLEGCFRKDVDLHRARRLPIRLESAVGEHRLGLMVASEIGTSRKFQAPVLSLGDSIPYPNQSLWLRLDLDNLAGTRIDSVAETTWVMRKRYGEPGILLPPSKRYWVKLSSECDLLVQENIAWLEAHRDVLRAIAEYYRSYRYEFIPDLDPDAALYQVGFFPKADEALGLKFGRANPEDMAGLIGEFTNPTARSLAVRIVGRNFPEHLPEGYSSEFEAYLKRVNPPMAEDSLKDYTGKSRTTAQSALAELRQLRSDQTLDAQQHGLLDELETYLTARFCKASSPSRSFE
jgi:exodeoxyribonuclease-1